MDHTYIEPTKFTNLRTGEESLGWRAYDDYDQVYDNTWEKEDMPEDDLKFLQRVLETSNDEKLWAMLESCEANKTGLYVGDTFIDWPQLLPLLETVRAK